MIKISDRQLLKNYLRIYARVKNMQKEIVANK